MRKWLFLKWKQSHGMVKQMKNTVKHIFDGDYGCEEPNGLKTQNFILTKDTA